MGGKAAYLYHFHVTEADKVVAVVVAEVHN
jgi:hypothetical protein